MATANANTNGDGGVKIAIRVRPLNRKEVAENALSVINVKQNVLSLLDPSIAGKDPTAAINSQFVRKFPYDFAFCSQYPEKPGYATQVFSL
jgi:hypothetical protein